MKKIKILAFLFLSLFVFGNTNLLADTTLTYTADNTILGLWYYDGSWHPVDLTLDLGITDLRIADSHTIPGPWEQVIWQVVNRRDPSAENPGGFLGQVGNLLSSSNWEVGLLSGTNAPLADLSSLSGPYWSGWSPASTTWGVFGGPYANNNITRTSIWYSVTLGPVLGISPDAQWIWTAANFDMGGAPGDNDSVFIRVTNPVPEPATMILVGSGLLGLAGLRRKFKK